MGHWCKGRIGKSRQPEKIKRRGLGPKKRRTRSLMQFTSMAMAAKETAGLIAHLRKENFNAFTTLTNVNTSSSDSPQEQLHIHATTVSEQRLAAFGLEKQMEVGTDSRAMASMSNETADFT